MSELIFSVGNFTQCMSFAPQNIQINNFEQYTLYCIDCENVQQFDTKTLNATIKNTPNTNIKTSKTNRVILKAKFVWFVLNSRITTQSPITPITKNVERIK